MKNLLLLVFLCFAVSSYGHINPKLKQKIENNTEDIISSRNDCQPALAQDDLDINNVRARLLVGGDLWWNKAGDGRYIVPKPAPGFDDVSALFAGGVWIGGYDQNDNLKLAAGTFSTGSEVDWYAGPLDEDTGTTESETCANWDQFYTIRGQEVREHVAYIDRASPEINCDSIGDNVKYWPSKGNPFFAEKYGFQLPTQDLAPFFDFDVDGIYNPCAGDFPIVDVRGCEPVDGDGNGDIGKALKLLPDEMKFWIYNDAGNQHLATRASQIQMEVRVQAFAYATNDEINDMTFYRYKLVNRATDPIGECYFAMFVDPDLGCHEDDYIGCDTTKVPVLDRKTGETNLVSRDFMYVYNQDKIDGTGSTCNCDGNVATYCDDVPALGVDYFRGPRRPYQFERDTFGNLIFDEDGKKVLRALQITDTNLEAGADTLLELGMTSFTYFNNGGIGDFPDGTTDPEIGFQFYNYMTGRWKDGTRLTNGGSGYDPESTDYTSFALPSFPNSNGWNMCTANLPVGDRRTVQSTGPLLLAPGATNELIIGVVYVPSMVYPCPDLTRLIAADEIAQNLFDACFEIIDGPNAPDLYSVELDRQLILMLGNDNDPIKNNNANEEYEGLDINAPLEVEDNTYKFEGYKIFQLADANVTVQELDDVERARLVRQVDIKNEVSEIYNWTKESNPLPEFSGKDVWSFARQVDGANTGLEHSFNILADAFADGDTKLINHKNYHYTVLAYAYNNYGTFNESAPESTQKTPYLEGRMNVETYTFTPRPIIYSDVNSGYGDEAIVTRLDGQGTGLNFLDMEDHMYDLIINGEDNGEIAYKKGNSPINVKVTDPLRITDGEYRLEIVGEYEDDDEDPVIAPGALWTLTDVSSGTVIAAEKSIDQINEQLIAGKGFSVSIGQVGDPGTFFDEDNGYIGQVLEYDDASGNNWIDFINPSGGFTISDGNPNTDDPSIFAFAQSSNDIDPDGAIINNSDYFIPQRLARWNIRDIGGQFGQNYSPGWQEIQQAADNRGLDLKNLNNIDLVMTSDKSKWSRCPVVETAISNYSVLRGFETIGEAGQFDLRRSPSVDKEGNADNTGEGMGWFPGYAVDVETGERLIVFFGENSIYRDDLSSNEPNEPGTAINGDDMIFNPTSDLLPEGSETLSEANPFTFYGGGQHYIYVTRVPYTDENIEEYSEELGKSSIQKRDAISMITYTGWPILSQTAEMLTYEEGWIPNDVKVKLRAANPYNKQLEPDGAVEGRDFITVGGLPAYNIKFENSAISAPIVTNNEELLKDVNVVPNPYYAYSTYESSNTSKVIKITNLPDRAIVTIYSLDGKFIKQFNRDESPTINGGNNPVFTSNQTAPAIEWDLNNFRGIPVASGVYIFHIEAPDLNASTSLKWFGVNRRFDASSLGG